MNLMRSLLCAPRMGIQVMRLLVLILGLAVLAQAPSVRAEAFYGVTTNGIFSVDSVSGGPGVQLVTFAAPLAQAATLAVRPSDGMLFYLDSGNANPGLWRWDPSTPATPPVFLGTPGATTTGVIRLAFDAAGTLYAMNPSPATLWTLDPNTGAILTTTPASGATVPGGGDICLHPATGVLYVVAGTQLFTLTPSGVVTLLGNMTGLPGNATGCAFDRNGRLVVSPGTTLYAVNIGSLASTALPAATGVGAFGDLATAPGRVADLSLTKTANNLTPGTTVSFTITVNNAGPDRATDVRVLDALPAGLTFVSSTVSQGAYATAASGVIPAGTWRVGTLNNGASATLTINATVTGTTPIINTAQISFSDQFDPDSTPNNNAAGEDDQASVTIIPSVDLQIVKTATSSFAAGTNATYSLTVNNLLGSVATSGVYTVIDNMPSGLTIVGTPSGTGWTCTSSTATQLSCTSNAAIAAGGTNPNLITLTVLPGAAAVPSVTNIATVSGGNEPAANNGNNSSTITTAVCATTCPDLVVNKTLSVASLTVGVNTSVYTLSVTNAGGLTTGANSYTITDTLPTGLTLAAVPTAGAGWTCTANAPALENVINGTKVICSRSTAIAPGAASTTITFPVNVANTAVPSVINPASVTGGGEPASATGNNTTTLTTPVIDFDLTVTKTATSAFTLTSPTTTATYSIVVNNIGGRATTTASSISVTDTLPAGLTFVSGTGTGWTNCTAAGQVVTCVRPAANTIAANASAPAITLTVTVDAAAAPSVSNTATVSKPDEASPANTGNNSSTVVTPVNAPNLVVTKSHTGNFTVGQTGTYTITVFNSGAQATTTATVTVTDTLPAGLTYVSASGSASGTGWTCAAATAVPTQTVTCTRTTAIAANSAAPPITLPVTVAAAAAIASPVTNNVNVSGGGEPAGNNGNNTDADITAVFFSPSIAKGFAPASVAAGATSVLTLTISNPLGNTVSLNGVAVVDPFPAGMAVAATPAFSNTCGGTISSGNAQGDTVISLTGGGPVAPGASCAIQVSVTSTTIGANVNTTGQVSSTNSGTGNTATATLTVTAPGSPVLSKLTNPNPVGVNQLSTMTFTIVNQATTTNDMAFTDTFPAGVVYQGTVAGGTCASNTGTAFALTNHLGAALVAGTSVGIRAVGIDLAGNASCTIIINVSSATAGNYANLNANITGLAGGLTANVSDTLLVVGTTLTKAFSPTSVTIGVSSNLTFTITNGAGTPGQGGLAFTETLPLGVVVASVPVATQCSGTVTATAGGNTISFSGGAMVLGQATCTIVAAVNSSAAGTYNNSPANVTGVSAGMTNNATATLTVVTGVALSVTKTVIVVCDPVNFNGTGGAGFFPPKSIPGAYMRYEIKIENGAGALTSATLTTIGDTLDPNLNFDADLRTGSASACATSAPESGATGNGFKLTCAGGTRLCNTPVFYTTNSGDDAIGLLGSAVTANFGDSPTGTKALPTEAGYGPGELKPGESVTIRFNTIVK